jgi:hypothetical protein
MGVGVQFNSSVDWTFGTTEFNLTFFCGWSTEGVYRSKPRTLDELEQQI